MSIKTFSNVYFDTEQKTFTIMEGSIGEYLYTEIIKCSIVFEDSKYTDKTELFSHQVLVTDMMLFRNNLFLPHVCIGMKYTLKDGKELYSYISKKKIPQYSTQIDKEKKEAQKIKDFVDKIIRKYNLV